ncbi:MAG: Na+/H+ antiporter NhaB [Saprospiraceae bacterium]|jgi:Na+/H+ antiporter NhaB
MKRYFNRILLIINTQTLIIASLAVLSTAFCIHFKYEAEFPLTLVATAVIFPIVFSIGGAYKRREVALRDYAEIKGYLRAMYFVSRDWLENLNHKSANEN